MISRMGVCFFLIVNLMLTTGQFARATVPNEIPSTTSSIVGTDSFQTELEKDLQLDQKLEQKISQTMKIQIWHQMMYTPREVLREVANEFEKNHPRVKLQLVYKETEELRSSFQSAALGGSGPELIYGPSDLVGPLVSMGLLAKLDSDFSSEEQIQFDPSALVHLNGDLWMVGDTVGNHLHLIYNRKLIQNPPRRVSELIKMAKELTIDKNGDGIPDQYGLVFHMMEPFFFVPWVKAFGASFVDKNGLPQLNSPAVKKAFELMRTFKNAGIMPKEADYEIANALFKEGKAAMIINGDWSWGDYQTAKIDFGIARLPMVDETGLWPAPLVSTKGYAINGNLNEPDQVLRRKVTLRVLKYLLSPEVQLKFTERINSLPSNLQSRKSPIVQNSQLLRDSADILSVGEPMAVVPELRATWDSLRPEYQAVLTMNRDATLAGDQAQKNALNQIEVMNHVEQPNWQAWVIKALIGASLILAIIIFLREIPRWIRELKGPQQLGYYFLLPGLILIFLVVIVPLAYSTVLSFSNLSLRSFGNWQIVGVQNYLHWFQSTELLWLFLKTLLWTAVNLFFHVTLGIALALCLDGVLPGKKGFRALLILPWAVPQYITALTWRGLFNQEYGAVNLVIKELLHLSPVQWLSRPVETFSACILTNVWLGFPFMMVVALAGLQSIPQELYEAARMDGATSWNRFRHLIWPLLKPVMSPAILLGAIWTFNNLNVIWLVSNGGEPSDNTHILVSSVYKSAFHLYRYGSSAALSMIIFVILASLIFLLSKFQKRMSS